MRSQSSCGPIDKHGDGQSWPSQSIGRSPPLGRLRIPSRSRIICFMNAVTPVDERRAPPAIHTLAQLLARGLDQAYPPCSSLTAGSQPLREACERFGAAAAGAHLPLEDAMAAAIEVLQAFFDRLGGHASDPATTIAAGIALAAVAHGYHQRAVAPASQESFDNVPTQEARLRALYRINRAATANLDLSEMLDTVVRVVAEATQSDACAVFLYDPVTDSLALRAAVGLNPSSVGALVIRPGSGITGRAAIERRPIVAPDTHTHDDLVSTPGFGDAVYASQASVPMQIHMQGQDRLVGVLNILTIARREFDDEELDFLQTVAGELAISIENARLYSRTDARLRRKVAELATLQRVSRTVASSLDLPNVLRSIAEAAVELIRAEAAAIFRLPRRPGATNGDHLPIIEYRVGYSRQPVDAVQRDQFVLDVIRSGSARATEITYLDGAGRLYCLPLRSARETWGALCLRLPPGAELTEDELGLLQAFTDSASIAIENAQLYQDAKHGLETASTLLQEMHHRVRNNLQTVAALLSIQLRQISDGPAAHHLREAISRVQAIAGVHELLSDEDRLAGATIDAIARLVAEEAQSTLIPPGLHVEFVIPPTGIAVSSKQATILALLINELVANAVSHGFRTVTRGTITIRAHQTGRMATIEVENDGLRLPPDFNPQTSRGLGMRIIQRLVSSDLRGNFRLQSSEAGTVASITFPLTEP